MGRGQIARRQELLGQIASVLKRQAERLHMAALVTNQVTTAPRAADEGADSDRRPPTPAPATRPPPPPPPRRWA